MKQITRNMLIVLLLLVLSSNKTDLLNAQTVDLPAPQDPQIENLAFKILQKQAAEYERALSDLISKNIEKYIPDDRFHLSVRIFWNPNKLAQIKMKRDEIKKKSGKLPGFNVFVRNKEESLDYYLGAGSVMKLKVEVLIDETLPKHYTKFIHEIVPIQARFITERGDSVRVTAIPFPKAKKRTLPLDKDIPLSADGATNAVMSAVGQGMRDLSDIQPVIIHPVLQKYISDYERFLKSKLQILVEEYIEKKNFLLDIKFFWNAGEIDKLKKLITRRDVEGKVKLPGFGVWIEEKDSLYDTIASSTTLMRMEISIMLDQSVEISVEPFLKKVIPISIKFMPERGDKLVIFRGDFPKLGEELKLSGIRHQRGDRALIAENDTEQEINNAFFRGDYRRGILLVDLLLGKTTDPVERLPLLKKKGSFHIMLQERKLAKLAWDEVKKMNESDAETSEILEYME